MPPKLRPYGALQKMLIIILIIIIIIMVIVVTLLQIDEATKVFRLSDDTYRHLMSVLNSEMDRGLKRASHHEATVKMFHTYVRSLPTGAGLFI